MTTSETDVIQIIETNTKLRANQRISRRIHLSCHTVGLKTKDPCCHIINIVPPAGYHRISVYLRTRNSSSCQRTFEAIPSLFISDLFLESDAASLPYETIFAFTTEWIRKILRVAASCSAFWFPPEVMTAFAVCPWKSYLDKSIGWIVFFGIGFELWSYQNLHFLHGTKKIPWR